MESKNEELYIINLKWKNTFKRVYLGGEKGSAGQEKFQKALTEIENIGDIAESWEDFFNKSLKAFGKYGFKRVDI